MRLRKLLLGLFLAALLPLGAVAERYTVMVSLDGFRADYVRAYNTPFIDSLARMGVSATMQPSFPSKTFPNHYTLVTGLVPDHHGIIANTFDDKRTGKTFSLGNNETRQDPQYWGGEPVWHTAARQGVRTGVVYWPGSDVKILGVYPAYYHNYMDKPLLSFASRISEVERYLRLPEAERPRLVLIYFEEPDHLGHLYSPQSKEARASVERMDRMVAELYEGLQTLPIRDSINFILLSDHGMTTVDDQHVVNPYDYVDRNLIENIRFDIPTHVWPKKGKEKQVLEALQKVPHARAWRKGEVPAYLHYGTNANIGDIVLLPDCGWMIGETFRSYPGAHGFDPTCQDMQVIFRAVGPDFKQRYNKKDVFPNTSVYPLLCRLLNITPAAMDGTLAPISDVLR